MKSSNIEKLQEVWPEMIAYGFNIDPAVAQSAHNLNDKSSD
jgi:hypothetical protein